MCDALGRECEYRLAAAANDSDEGSAPSKSRKSKKAVTSPTSVPNGLPVASTSAYTLPTTAEGIAGSVDSYSRSAGVESTIMLLEQLLAKYKGTSGESFPLSSLSQRTNLCAAVSPTEQDALSSMRSTLREDEQEIVQAAIKDMARQQQQQQQQQQQEQ